MLGYGLCQPFLEKQVWIWNSGRFWGTCRQKYWKLMFFLTQWWDLVVFNHFLRLGISTWNNYWPLIFQQILASFIYIIFVCCFSVLGAAATFMCNAIAINQQSHLETQNCVVFCTYESDPHCAQNKHGFQKTINNKCELGQINCSEDSSNKYKLMNWKLNF